VPFESERPNRGKVFKIDIVIDPSISMLSSMISDIQKDKVRRIVIERVVIVVVDMPSTPLRYGAVSVFVDVPVKVSPPRTTEG
jgi:hypothetical protein